ncbi:MAG TPA: hypothetical protein V6C97_12515 [Oculatellaceae cyanobacterium]
MTAKIHDGLTAQQEKFDKRLKPGDPTIETMSSAAQSAQDEAQTRDRKVQQLLSEDDRQYDSEVSMLIVNKLLGKNGKDKDRDQVAGRDGRYYPGTTHWTLPELDENGKPTGKTIDSDKLSNSELAKLLEKTIADYDKIGDRDGGKAYEEERRKSQLPQEMKEFQDASAEAVKLLRIGDSAGLSTGDAERLLKVHGDFSTEDKALLERIGGSKAVEAFTKARDAWQQYDKDSREFNEKMTQEGIFFSGKTKLCCCVNSRNKAIGMIYRARTGNAPAGASCLTGHLENIL